MIKKFFNIQEDNYKFEIYDVTALITMLNVAFVVMGFTWAPILGLVNCAIFFVLNTIQHAHINAWITQISLIILNMYFLTM